MRETMDRTDRKGLIVFDLDGTLIDTALYIALNYVHLFEKYSVPCPSLETLVSFSGPPLTMILAKYFPNVDMKVLLDDFEAFSLKYSNHYSSLYPGETECLAALKEEGYTLAILTSKRRVAMDDNLSYFGIDKYFDFTVSLDECRYPKPNPDSLLFIMEKTGYAKEDTYIIGDSYNDCLTGINAGTRSGLVTYGLKKEKTDGVDDLFPDFASIKRRFVK